MASTIFKNKTEVSFYEGKDGVLWWYLIHHYWYMTDYAYWPHSVQFAHLVETSTTTVCKDAHMQKLPASHDFCSVNDHLGVLIRQTAFESTSFLVKPSITYITVVMNFVRRTEPFGHWKMSLFRILESPSSSMMHHSTGYCICIWTIMKRSLPSICNGSLSVIICRPLYCVKWGPQFWGIKCGLHFSKKTDWKHLVKCACYISAHSCSAM